MKSPPKDRRLIATFAILGTTLGMLALCVPLSLVAESNDSLPFWTIAASTVSTLGVWLFGKPKAIDERQTKEIVELQSTIAELKERLENVEVMSRFESKLAADEENEIRPTRTMGPESESD